MISNTQQNQMFYWHRYASSVRSIKDF